MKNNESFIYLGYTQVNLHEIVRGVWKDQNYVPPPVTYYTHFSLKEYFLLFWGLLVIQNIIIFICKQRLSPVFRSLNFFEKMLHSMENSHFPFPVDDWDQQKGSCNDHYRRMKNNRTETLVITGVNLAFNLILLVPLFILSKMIENITCYYIVG